MRTVTVCVGSSCHIKGSRRMIVRFDELLKEHGLEGEIELKGSFCMERCGEGLNWQIGNLPITSRTVEEAIETFTERLIRPELAARRQAGGEAGRGGPA